MIMETQPILEISLTPEEEKAFFTVEKVLKQLQKTYILQTSFESVSDGTIFEIDELPRVRGVLDTIAKNTYFRMR